MEGSSCLLYRKSESWKVAEKNESSCDCRKLGGDGTDVNDKGSLFHGLAEVTRKAEIVLKSVLKVFWPLVNCHKPLCIFQLSVFPLK